MITFKWGQFTIRVNILLLLCVPLMLFGQYEIAIWLVLCGIYGVLAQ